jgi:hypothetical protein
LTVFERGDNPKRDARGVGKLAAESRLTLGVEAAQHQRFRQKQSSLNNCLLRVDTASFCGSIKRYLISFEGSQLLI